MTGLTEEPTAHRFTAEAEPVLPAGREAVTFWRGELAKCYEGARPETDQARRLQPFVGPFDLPREAFEDVIDGVAMDLDTTRYRTFDDLFEYCRRVASAVGDGAMAVTLVHRYLEQR